MIYLIDPGKKQYKANLHCHSTLSDGKKTPQELKDMYKNKGYSILAITDHERPRQHQELADDDFLMITGYEGYIRPGVNPDAYGEEIHINLFARDPYNVKMVCFDDRYIRYLKRDEAFEEIAAMGESQEREYSVEYINHYVKTAIDEGYIAAYNHPYWSMASEADILAYEGFFSIEMCNYSSYVINNLEYSGPLYDKLLRSGKRIFCHGADDNHNAVPLEHPNSDSFGGFTMIMPEEFTYDGVFTAMERGQMYSSMGPSIFEVSFEDGKLHIECSDAKHIMAYVGSKRPRALHADEGRVLNSADFEIDERAKYIRVSIEDSNGHRADTRGFFADEFGMDSWK